MKKIISVLLLVFAIFSGAFVASENFNIAGAKAYAARTSEVQALHILVPSETQALQIRSEIMQGQTQNEVLNNFMSAAKKYSKCPSGNSGGYLGWFGKGTMVKEFETAAFNLEPGTVSEPIKTDFGWHLIYVVSKK